MLEKLKWISNKKNIISLNLLFVVVTIIFFIVFPTNELRDYHVERYSSDNDYMFKIYGDNYIYQQFSSDLNNINQFELALNISDNNKDLYGEVNVELRNDDGSIVQKWIVKKKDIYVNSWTKFDLNKNLEKDKSYYLYVSANNLTEENCITIRGTESLAGIELQEGIEYQSCFYSYYNGYNEGCIYLTLEHSYNNYFAITAIILILLLLNYLYFNRNKEVEQYSFIAMLLIGLIMIVIMANGSGPDERYHYNSSYMLSNVIMGKDSSIVFDDGDTFDYDQHYNSNSTFIKELLNRSNYTEKDVTITSLNELRNPANHLFQAIGISISRAVGIHGVWLYIIARFANMLGYVIVCQLAIKIVPTYKMVFFIYAINPMAMHQATQLSYDSFINSFSLLYIALVLKNIVQEEYPTIKGLFKVVFITYLFSQIKVVYYCHLLLLLIYVKKKQLWHIKYFAEAVALVVVLKFVDTIMYIRSFQYSVTTLASSSTNVTNNPYYYSLRYCLYNPLDAFILLFRTLSNQAWDYVMQANGSLLAGLNVSIPAYLVVIYISLLILVYSYESNIEGIVATDMRRVLLITGIIEFVVVTASGFLMTRYGENSLEGLQGRYYIPCLLMILLGTKHEDVRKKIDGKTVSFIICLIYMVIVNSVMRQIVIK